MEVFGILFSIPVAFVASMVYCALLTYTLRQIEWVRRWLYTISVVLLIGFIGEVSFLATVGAVASRALVGPGFYVAHTVFFLLGTPALANVLLLRKSQTRDSAVVPRGSALHCVRGRSGGPAVGCV